MTVVEKVDLTLKETNAPADALRTFSKGMNVELGEEIIYEGEKYKAAKAMTNIQTEPNKDIANFAHMGAINEKAMFDRYIGTQTRKKDGQPLKFKIDTGKKRVNCFSFFNVDGSEITVRKAGAVIAHKRLLNAGSRSWWEYFFEFGQDYKKDVVLYADKYFGEFEIEITPNRLGANLGHFSAGQRVFLGYTELEAEFGVNDYSKKQKTAYGDVFIAKGRTANYMSLAVVLPTPQIDRTRDTLKNLCGELTTFIGDEKDKGFKSLLVFGFLNDFRIKITGEQYSSLSINVEGII